MKNDKVRKTEQLLEEAAGWEPQRAAPERLAQRALALALEQEARPRRRPSPLVMVLTLVFGGGAAAAALSGTLLLAFRPATEAPIASIATPKATLAGYRTQFVERPALPVPSRPRLRPRQEAQLVARRSAPTPRVVSRVPARAPRANWSTEEVERRQTGVIAPGVVVEPDPETGALYLLPAVVDIPLTSGTACQPDGEPTEPSERLDPAAPTPEPGAPRPEPLPQ